MPLRTEAAAGRAAGRAEAGRQEGGGQGGRQGGDGGGLGDVGGGLRAVQLGARWRRWLMWMKRFFGRRAYAQSRECGSGRGGAYTVEKFGWRM
mgnify:CR=1 FL=1